MVNEVRKIYYEAGATRLKYNINKLIEELYPNIKCYIVDALNVDNIILNIFSSEERNKVSVILRKRYPLKGNQKSISEIAKETYYDEKAINNILVSLKFNLVEKRYKQQIFACADYLIPETFIDRSMEEIYQYISSDIEGFKDNIEFYQTKVLERLLYYPKIKKSLAVFIYEYLLLLRGYAFPRCHESEKIEREYRIYAEGERELRKYGLDNILDLINNKDIAFKIKRYIFEEYSQYIIALLSNSDIITENLLNSYKDDDKLAEVVSNKNKKGEEDISIKELKLSTMAYNCLLKAKYKYINQIPKGEREIRCINKIGKATAKEIYEKLVKWYEDNGEVFLDTENKDIDIYCVGFSERVYNSLKRAGYRKITDIPTDIDEIKSIPKLGQISVNEVIAKLKEYNITVY